uniref:ABC1 atypical kinase-like domain-containing protein n=1 Tax=Craspedostauros australis TaxID=1486917 RepID=A0A7R9ZSJ4_9STRA|mmetsp:Transcript_868/g.2465  ORF Transcript_868/g.2465 Transcript_868/m.2465 type:complete len:293 (+) Transcript_868:1-879(+)
MAAQAHLQVEAYHLEVLNHNFRDWDHVRFPQPFFASSTVIIETFEPGRIITEIIDRFDSQAATLEDDTRGYDLMPLELSKFLLTSGLAVYMKMLLVDNLMHADLHPGNIMFDLGPVSQTSKQQAITLVDAGMVAQLSDAESANFIGLIICLGEGDGRRAAEFALKFSSNNQNMEPKRREAFIDGMEAMFAVKCRGYGTNVNAGNVLRGVLSLINDHHIRIEANYATLVINVLCIESMGHSLCPSYNLLDASKPLLRTYQRICFEKDGLTPRRDPRFLKVRVRMWRLQGCRLE